MTLKDVWLALQSVDGDSQIIVLYSFSGESDRIQAIWEQINQIHLFLIEAVSFNRIIFT